MAAEVPSLSAPTASASAESIIARRTPFGDTMRRLSRHRSAQVGAFILFVLILVAIFAPVIAPYDPTLPLRDVKRRDPPCIHLFGCPADKPQHIMGIDGNSRDLFSRIIYGSRLSLHDWPDHHHLCHPYWWFAGRHFRLFCAAGQIISSCAAWMC